MGVKYCCVYGCLNNSKQKTLSFHGLPSSKKNSEGFKKWLNIIGREDIADKKKPSDYRVCSVHFEEKMFVNEKLVSDAVPTLHLPDSLGSTNSPGSSVLRKDKESQVDFTKPPIELIKVEPYVTACRACLATDCRLYDVTECGLQDAFDKLAGAPVSTINGVRHLCLLCSLELSKYAAFRDRCQRVHELLATLQECGPLKMDDIRAIDRNSHKLTRNLAQTGVEIVDTTETEILLSTPLDYKCNNSLSTLVKTEKTDDIESDIDSVFVETNFKEHNEESEYSYETMSIELKQIKDTEINEVIVIKEKEPTTLIKRKNSGSSEASTKATKIDTCNNQAIEKQKKEPVTIKKRKFSGSSEDSTKMDTGNTEDIEKQENEPTTMKKKKTLASSEATKATKTDTDNTGKEMSKNQDYKSYKTYDYKALENKYKFKVTRLSEDEQRAEFEARKLTSNYLKSPHRCDFCGRGFNHLHALTNHMSYHDHSVGPFECEICHFRFATERRHTIHRRSHRLKFTCQECGFNTQNRTNACQHSGIHAGKRYACPHCARAFLRPSTCFNHVREAHPELNVACDQCGETFLSAKGVRTHKNKAHRENIKQQEFKCPTCDVNFNSLEALDKHTSTAPDGHTALTPCAVCGENCESAAALSEHTARRHPPDQYRCHECDATFSSAASFETHHNRKHLGLKRPQHSVLYEIKKKKHGKGVVCEICGKVMQNKTLLRYHQRTHTGERPFKCAQCPKSYMTPAGLQAHSVTHTGERRWRCPQCPKTFLHHCSLYAHKLVHTGEKPFVCEICGKAFSQSGSLQTHVKYVHMKVKPPPRNRRKHKPPS